MCRVIVLLGHVPQHGMQDAAVAVVVDFHGGVDATLGGELDFAAVVLGGDDFDVLAGLDRIVDGDVKRLGAGEAEAADELAPRSGRNALP